MECLWETSPRGGWRELHKVYNWGMKSLVAYMCACLLVPDRDFSLFFSFFNKQRNVIEDFWAYNLESLFLMAVCTINWRREKGGRQTRGEAIAIIWVLRRSTLKTNRLLFISGFVREKIISQHPSAELCEGQSLLGPLFWIIFHGQASPQGLRKCPAVDKMWVKWQVGPDLLQWLFQRSCYFLTSSTPGFPFSNI